MEIIGKIKKIMDTNVVSEKFKKRDFVVTTDYHTPYPQHILFQTIQDKCSLLDTLNANDEVKVLFNIRGREWTSPQDQQVRYFVTLEAWRIEKVGEGASNFQKTSSNTTASTTNTAKATEVNTESDVQSSNDDLPF